jgi:hypothetical protein
MAKDNSMTVQPRLIQWFEGSYSHTAPDRIERIWCATHDMKLAAGHNNKIAGYAIDLAPVRMNEYKTFAEWFMGNYDFSIVTHVEGTTAPIFPDFGVIFSTKDSQGAARRYYVSGLKPSEQEFVFPEIYAVEQFLMQDPLELGPENKEGLIDTIRNVYQPTVWYNSELGEALLASANTDNFINYKNKADYHHEQVLGLEHGASTYLQSMRLIIGLEKVIRMGILAEVTKHAGTAVARYTHDEAIEELRWAHSDFLHLAKALEKKTKEQGEDLGIKANYFSFFPYTKAMDSSGDRFRKEVPDYQRHIFTQMMTWNSFIQAEEIIHSAIFNRIYHRDPLLDEESVSFL